MTPAELQARQLIVIVRAIAETIKESGTDGCPASSVYMALQALGLGIDTHKFIVETLKRGGMIREAGHVLYWINPAQPDRKTTHDESISGSAIHFQPDE